LLKHYSKTLSAISIDLKTKIRKEAAAAFQEYQKLYNIE
jgi:hypothetical protein